MTRQTRLAPRLAALTASLIAGAVLMATPTSFAAGGPGDSAVDGEPARLTFAEDDGTSMLAVVLDVSPGRQARVVSALERTTAHFSRLDGFVAAAVLRSTDGMRVTSYVQVQRRVTDRFRGSLRAASGVAASGAGVIDEPDVYDVGFVNRADGDDVITVTEGDPATVVTEATPHRPDLQPALFDVMTTLDRTSAPGLAGWVSTGVMTGENGSINLSHLQFSDHASAQVAVDAAANSASVPQIAAVGSYDTHGYDVVSVVSDMRPHTS
ncbi:MAG: hypothetical protein ACRCY8_11925 [Dermatophilaceae bacterium]